MNWDRARAEEVIPGRKLRRMPALAVLQIAAPNLPIPLRELDLKDHLLSDPFRPTRTKITEANALDGNPEIAGRAGDRALRGAAPTRP